MIRISKYKKTPLLITALLYASLLFSQISDYHYRQELSSISDQWHRITLPHSLFDHVNPDLSDIRIYGLADNDTIEAPYIIQIASEKQTQRAITFTQLNTVANSKGFYFTYEVPTEESIDLIHLEFKERNFDQKVVLEGSQDQKEWFTILQDYRILSISNARTGYSFTDLHFPASKFRYYRVMIPSDKEPEILAAELRLDDQSDAHYMDFPVTFMNITNKGKNTLIDIDLTKRLPLSYLKLHVADQIDYYRPLTVQYISDSVKTDKGWRYQYGNLYSGTLTSLERNGFRFDTVLAQKLRVTIKNHDNRPLQIESAEAKGYVHSMVARFPVPAKYYLAYGNDKAKKPYYDIVQAATIIPENLSELRLGPIENLSRPCAPDTEPLFQNPWWLWGIMAVTALVLGGFTLKMLRKE